MKLSSAVINQQPISFTDLNIFVGPNNVGKSTLLREIHTAITSGMISAHESKWLDQAQLSIVRLRDEVGSLFREEDISQIDNYENHRAAELVGFRPFRSNVGQNLRNYNFSSILNSDAYINNLDMSIEIPKLESTNHLESTPGYYIRRFLAEVGVLGEFCDSRSSGSYSTSIQDILQSEGDQSPVRYLRENSEHLSNIQSSIQNVFGVKIGFDDLQQGQKPLRILPSRRFPRGLDQKTLAGKWRESSPLVDTQGDGLRAYLKLALSLLDPFSQIIFIDEPETFLHPPQRRALGALIAEMARKYKKQVFLATHDSEFIRGLLNTGNQVKVLNLRDRQGRHEVAEIDLRDVRSVLNQRGNSLKERAPILNEAILNSLFYDKTILTENENDRMFYEYYSALRHGGALQNKRFIGLRGIDEVLKMMEKLNGLGVNVASVVDIDFIITRYAPRYIQDREVDLHAEHVILRGLFNELSASDKDVFRKNLKELGLKAIGDNSLRQRYEDVISRYAKIGIYIPEVGELESWTGVSKNNLSQMVGVIEDRNPRKLNKFIKEVLS